MNKEKPPKAFTLIELLVVIAIIGILSSVVLASLSGARESAKVTRMVSDLEQIETGFIMWMDAKGNVFWPIDSNVGGNPPIKNLAASSSIGLGEYLNSVPEPPFGATEYRYDNDGEVITSCPVSGSPAASIFVNGVDKDVAEGLNEIIEGDTSSGSQNLDCGKFRWRTNSNGQIFYMLSKDGKL